MAILTRAAECIDRIAAARASIAKDGAIIENQYGVAKMNPACVLEKAARDGFFAAMRLLGIDMSAGISLDPPPWAGMTAYSMHCQLSLERALCGSLALDPLDEGARDYVLDELQRRAWPDAATRPERLALEGFTDPHEELDPILRRL